jgi:butyryl-CoA dehydrogenase
VELTAQQLDIQRRAYAAGKEFAELSIKWDAEDKVDYAAVAKRMGELGFFGLTAPKEYGGQGLTCLDYFLAVSEILRASGSWICCEPLFATSGPGPSMLMLSKNEKLREKYLRQVVTGRLGCGIALTEPQHGSDLTHIEASAARDGDGYIVNGPKSFVTGAMHNELYAIFVRFDNIPGAKGIGAVVISKDAPGFSMESGPEFMGVRGIPHGNVNLENVRVSKDDVIVGGGEFSSLMNAFNMERMHNCAASLGLMMGAFDEASQYVQKRQAFGRPLIEFQAVYHALADMAVTIDAHRFLSYHAATTAIDGRFPRMEAVSKAKLFGGTQVPLVTMKCLELMGGVGVTTKSLTQRLHRDAVTNVVAGGAPAVLRNSIASNIFPGLKFPQTRSH